MRRLRILVCALLILSVEDGEARVQLDHAGLIIQGTVMVPGTREPVSGVRVGLYRPDTVDPPTIGTTGPDGRFVFRGLAPGRHDLALPAGDASRLRAVKRVDLSDLGLPVDVELWLAPLSRVSGRVLDPEGIPVAGACVSLARPVWYLGRRFLESPPTYDDPPCETDADGRYTRLVPPGDYYLSARPDGSDVRQYYPGVASPGEAARVTVRGGGDLAGVDMRMTRPEAYRVSFRLALPAVPVEPGRDLRPMEDGETLVTAEVRSMEADTLQAVHRRVDLELGADGTWTTLPLVPGEHEMLLIAATGVADDGGTVRVRRRLIDRLRFRLEDEDLDLGMVSEAPRASVRGRMVTRSSRGGVLDAAQLPPLEFMDDAFTLLADSAEPGPDGIFGASWLHPGLFRVGTPRDVPEGWYLASVKSGAREVLLEGLDVTAGAEYSLEVVFADDAGEIHGLVRNADGFPARDARVILIPPAARRGPLGQFPAAVTDSSGVFALAGVPPGTYRLIALDEAGLADGWPYWESPEFLRDFELRGEPVTVDAGARLRIDTEAVSLVTAGASSIP